MDIEIILFRLVNGSSQSLKAVADVRIGELVVHNWKVIQKPGCRAQVTIPQVSWRDSTGHLCFRTLLTIPRDLRQRIEVAVLAAWEKELHSVNQPNER